MKRWRLRVGGVVQGVGFRPYVYHLAQDLGLAGCVANNSGGVYIEIEGEESNLALFRSKLIVDLPPAASIDYIHHEEISSHGDKTFRIIESAVVAGASTLISPDLAICADCLHELLDPADRRYHYPFINCTNCGPRFTIIRDLPYDRPKTTMEAFRLCVTCESEYHDPNDRRFHAQPNACPNCGPQLEFIEKERRYVREEALIATREALLAGKIVALKGLGGFHIACDATNQASVTLLRARKGRPHKPFAIMVSDLHDAQNLGFLNAKEIDLLTSRQAPIVLIKRRQPTVIAQAVAPNNPYLGVLLPYTPLHHLLLHELGIPLVMTSGNRSEESIIIDNDLALENLSGIADAFLLHNRAIQISCDDSVTKVTHKQINIMRRARGYAPLPIQLPFAITPMLAVGADMKNTFGLSNNDHAFMSQHIGDMKNLETLQVFEASYQHLSQLLQIQPQAVVCDLHPNYTSTFWAQRYALKQNLPLIRVQHHHAHIASVMAEHHLGQEEEVLGFCFDGTGYGTDGAIWGGEILHCTYAKFERLAHLAYVPLIGGESSIKNPYRMALAHLWAAGIEWSDDLAPVQACPPTERAILKQQLEHGTNMVPTSSMGRFFDAVASLIGIRQQVTYEAQAAMELEAIAEDVQTTTYRFGFETNQIDPSLVLRAICRDLASGESKENISGRVHLSLVRLISDISQRFPYEKIALSGGVFQNQRLLNTTVIALENLGFQVLTHSHIPTNDGGLAIGQLMVASQQFEQRSQNIH